MPRTVPLLAAMALATAPQPLWASTFQDLEGIDRRVAAFTGAAIGEPGGARMPVDRKLRLRMCEAALDLAWYGRNGEAVLVRCADPDGWRIFVPVGPGKRVAAPIDLVERRDLVRVEAGGAGFSVMRSGEALEGGAAGDWIRVRLEDDRRRSTVVTAQVQADGRVRVPLR